jgi:hypothetical protein
MIIMTKFIKKITKNVKDTQYCIVLGRGYGHFDELTEIFNTVFVLSNGVDEIRKKNVVYRNDFSDTNPLPYIGAVFVDEDQLDHLGKIDEIIRKHKLLIYVGTREFIPTHHAKFFSKRHYEVVEIFKDSQLWKHKK